MLQPILGPWALRSQLSQRHCYGISQSELRILWLLDQGYRNDEIASLTGVAAATVRRHVANLCQRVFDPTDIPPERDKLRTWVREHLGCCTLGVQEMIENAQAMV